MAKRFSIEAVFNGVDRITRPVNRMQNNVQKFSRSAVRNLRRVNRTADRMVGGLGRGAKSLAKYGGAAIAAGITATGIALNSVANRADALAKRSRRLQFPIEKLQEWQFVAEQSGLTGDEFNKSVEGMNKRLGELKAGSGSLFTFLNKTDKAFMNQLGSVSDSEEAMRLLIEKLQQTKDPMKQAALANAAFGRSGLKMSNIAEQGAKKIKLLRMEQQANGVITEQEANNAESYNDAIGSLGKSIRGLMDKALLPLMPTLEKYAKKMRQWILLHKPDIIKRIRSTLERLKPALKKVWEQIKQFDKKHGIIEFFGEALSAGLRFGTFLMEHGKTIAKATLWIGGLIIGLKIFTGVLTVVNLLMAANPFVLIALGIGVAIGAVVAIVKHWDKLTESFRSSGGWMDKVVIGLGLLTGPVGVLAAGAALVYKHWEPIKTLFFEVVDAIGGAVDAIKNFKMPELKMPTFDLPKINNPFKGLFGGDEKPARFQGVNKVHFQDDAANDEIVTRFRPHVVTPQERITRSFEQRQEKTEITIRDETGKASVTKGRAGGNIKLASTGGL